MTRSCDELIHGYILRVTLSPTSRRSHNIQPNLLFSPRLHANYTTTTLDTAVGHLVAHRGCVYVVML